MRKVIIATVLVALLSIAFVTPALADKGGQPNESSLWGQAHKYYNQGGDDPGAIGDVFSNDHQGWKGMDPPPYPGGIEDFWDD